MVNTIKLVFPSGHLGSCASDDALDLVLRAIALSNATPEHGWPDKYGCTVENDLFLMRPECWCQRDDGSCVYCMDGDHPDYDRLLAERFGTRNYQEFAARHYYDPPNFWYKPTDFRVKWYKYIGRDVATNRDIDGAELQQIAEACVKGGVDEAIGAVVKAAQESADKFSEILRSINTRGES